MIVLNSIWVIFQKNKKMKKSIHSNSQNNGKNRKNKNTWLQHRESQNIMLKMLIWNLIYWRENWENNNRPLKRSILLWILTKQDKTLLKCFKTINSLNYNKLKRAKMKVGSKRFNLKNSIQYLQFEIKQVKKLIKSKKRAVLFLLQITIKLFLTPKLHPEKKKILTRISIKLAVPKIIFQKMIKA